MILCPVTKKNHLENKLLLISINFTPKTSHSCLKKWYVPRFSRQEFGFSPNTRQWDPKPQKHDKKPSKTHTNQGIRIWEWYGSSIGMRVPLLRALEKNTQELSRGLWIMFAMGDPVGTETACLSNMSIFGLPILNFRINLGRVFTSFLRQGTVPEPFRLHLRPSPLPSC